MIEVSAGSVAEVFLTTYGVDGFPTAPSSTPTISIIDAETGATVETGSPTLISSENVGEYSYKLLSSSTSYDRVLKITWQYTISGKTTTIEEYLYVNTVYATVDEIISELGYSSNPSQPNYISYEKIASAERAARMIINTELGFSMNKKAKTAVAYGEGADVLILPERIISFEEIRENDELVIDTSPAYNIFGFNVEITETNQALRVVPPNPGDDIEEQETIDYIGLSYGRFRNGFRYNIKGIFGWNYIPQEIKQATFLIVNDLLCSDSVWRTKYIKKIDANQMSVELSPRTYNGTGNAIADSLIQKFKMIQAVII